jgi:hypothetical protein
METWRRVRELSSLWIRPGQTSADEEQLLIFAESIGPTYILFFLVVYGKPHELYKKYIIILVIGSSLLKSNFISQEQNTIYHRPNYNKNDINITQ